MTSILVRLSAFILLLFLLPVFLLFYILIKTSSPGPFLFTQKRMGKNRKIFTIYKIRTMVENAEKLKDSLKHLNQYQPPIFKIHDDPRYTRIGKLLANCGIDELPQLINVFLEEMAFVGPRPLPISEAKQISKKYKSRFTVLPGILPPWLSAGPGVLTSKTWLDIEMDYIRRKSYVYDLSILLYGVVFLIKAIFKISR